MNEQRFKELDGAFFRWRQRVYRELHDAAERKLTVAEFIREQRIPEPAKETLEGRSHS